MLKLNDLQQSAPFTADPISGRKTLTFTSKSTGITLTISGGNDYLQGTRETSIFKAIIAKDQDQPDFDSFIFG